MDLSVKDRLFLLNQYKLLELLSVLQEDEDEAESYRLKQEIVERGFASFYGDLIKDIDSQGLTEEQCTEVAEILAMFSHMQIAYDQMSDKEEINPQDVVFPGFDLNHEVESRYLMYTRFLIERKNHFNGLRKEDSDFNSHSEKLVRYRMMLSEWEDIKKEWKEPYYDGNLEKTEILRIINARKAVRH